MTGVDKLHAEGLTGVSITVGIIDTGIDYTHPALGGCFGPGCKVIGGTDLVGDNYNGTNTPVPGTFSSFISSFSIFASRC
jgi:subtilisin family serine protease